MRTLFLSLLLCPLAALAQAPVIEISGANFRPLPIARLPPFGYPQGTPHSRHTT